MGISKFGKSDITIGGVQNRTHLKMTGYQQAMQEHGLEPITLQTEQASSFSLGASLLGQLLDEHLDVDGIFCTNDDLAIGALYECQRREIKVPEDIAIAGFHGLDISKAMVPKLATVITPREEIGKIAAEQILNRLKGNKNWRSTIDLGYRIESGDSL